MLQSVAFQSSDGQYEPAGHAVHVDAELAPVMDDTDPRLHNDGNSDPGRQNAPAGHSLQSDSILPDRSDRKVPPGQETALALPRKQ